MLHARESEGEDAGWKRSIVSKLTKRQVAKEMPPAGGGSQRLTESVVDAYRPCHALLTLDRREDLSRVLECHWSFSERVADGEEVHEEHDWPDLCCFRAIIVEKRETGGEQEDAHSRERDKGQGTTTFSVDEEQGRDGRYDLDGAIAERGEQGLVRGVSGSLED